MQYRCYYDSPLGKMRLAEDETGLCGVWFEGQKYFEDIWDNLYEEKETAVLQKAKRWLDIYFSGKEPDFQIPLHLKGTEFQMKVWGILSTIPYGKTITYGEIAREIAEQCGENCVAAQAVGGAIGRNRIAIIVPCHRVIGSDGSLTGYAGGVDRKKALLQLEKQIEREGSVI